MPELFVLASGAALVLGGLKQVCSDIALQAKTGNLQQGPIEVELLLSGNDFDLQSSQVPVDLKIVF